MKVDYSLSVGEPWDFKSIHGKNIIKGEILKIFDPKFMLYKMDSQLTADDFTNDVLILTPRHAVIDFTDLSSEGVIVNAALLHPDFNNILDLDLLKDNCKFIIIGSLRNT